MMVSDTLGEGMTEKVGTILSWYSSQILKIKRNHILEQSLPTKGWVTLVVLEAIATFSFSLTNIENELNELSSLIVLTQGLVVPNFSLRYRFFYLS